ncbi:MAG: PKD repeat protein, partial [Psychroserpens sp.]
MRKTAYISSFLILLTIQLFGQITTADFTLPAEVCPEEQFQPTNTSTNAINYEWDLCPGDFQIQPVLTSFQSSTNYKTNNNITIFTPDKFSASRTVFLPSGGSKKIYKFNTNDDLSTINSVEALDLGATTLGRPIDIEFIKKGTDYFGYLLDFNLNKLFEIEFGNSIHNAPVNINDLGNFSASLNQPIALAVTKSGDSTVIQVANYNSTNLTTIYKKADNTFSHTNFDLGGNRASDIDVLKLNGTNHIIISFFQSGEIRYYANDLLFKNDPIFINQYSNPLMPSPNNAKWIIEGDSIKAIVQSNNGNIGLIRFNQNITSIESFSNYGNFGLLNNNTRGISITQNSKSEWIGLIPFINNDIYKLNFLNNCSENDSITNELSPQISYSIPEEKNITLITEDSKGNKSFLAKTLSVLDNPIPGNLLLNDFYCITDNFAFNFSSLEEVVSYSWDFGDGNSSNAISPIHNYINEGEYFVSLEVKSATLCPTTFYDTISILPEPIPNFTTSKTEYCTFESISFSNNTPFDFGENISWSWNFNGEGASSAKNLTFTFETAGTKSIILEANVLGCIKTFQSTLEVIEGPEPSFSFDTNCVGESIQFTNLSSGDNIIGYLWNFDNGQTSTANNPEVTYNSSGDYGVTLTVSNANGCENTITQNIRIFEQVVDSIYSSQLIENIPFQLGVDWDNDFDSTQNLSYQWNINGEILTNDTAQYVLATGTYIVNLLVTTENNCLFSTQRQFEVEASEAATPFFNLPSAVCVNEQFQLENLSVNEVEVVWNFCSDDLNNQPTITSLIEDQNLSLLINIEVIPSEDLEYTAFIASADGNIYKTQLNNDLSAYTDLLAIDKNGLEFERPIDFKIIHHMENYFGYMIDFNSSNLYEFDFGNSLDNTPNIVNYGDLETLNQPISLQAVVEDGRIKLLISNYGSNYLSILSKYNNEFSSFNLLTGSTQSWGVDLFEIGNNKWLVGLAYRNSNLLKFIEFNNGISSTDYFISDFTNPELSAPTYLQFLREGTNLNVIAKSSDKGLIRLKYDNLNINNLPIITSYGNLNVLTQNSYGFQFVQNSNFKWYGLVVQSNSLVRAIQFPQECKAESSYVFSNNVRNFFSQPGTYPITLTATHPNGSKASITKEITVTNNIAPELYITSSSIEACIGNAINFEGTSPEAITNWQWSFGNGDSAFVQSPTYSFDMPGTYQIITEGISDNDCKNLAIQEVTIYEPPAVSFNKSTQGTFCSQKPIDFFNTTSLPTNATFSWDFGDGTTSTEENPSHTFAAAGEYT